MTHSVVFDMDNSKAKVPTTIRLSRENQEKLELALKLGWDCAEVANNALKEALGPYLKKRTQALKATLAEV